MVERLERAGAIVVGKTNLDQFATGLVGVRSPYGVPRNALRADLIPGGSSSGSATAVGAGLVPFSLGTDTAGSGRVPAALNGIVGLKPSLGALSASGRRSGLPHARHDLDLRARRRRRLRRLRGGLRLRREGRLVAAPTRRRRCRALPRGCRFGVPRRDQLRVLRRRGSGGRLRAATSPPWRRSAAGSSNSISSRSPRSRVFSTKARGSPSATPRRSR